jgi:hypothetical protein
MKGVLGNFTRRHFRGALYHILVKGRAHTERTREYDSFRVQRVPSHTVDTKD